MVRLLVLISAMGFIYPMNAPLGAPIKRDAAIKAKAPIAVCAVRSQDAGSRLLAELCVFHATAVEALLRLVEGGAASPRILFRPASSPPLFHLRI